MYTMSIYTISSICQKYIYLEKLNNGTKIIVYL
jgi:hypothetical protein